MNLRLFLQFVNVFVCFCRLWLNCFRESEKNRQEPVTNTEGQVNVTMSLNQTESATVRLQWRTTAIVELWPTDFGRPIPGSGLASLLDKKNHVISENQHNCDNLHRCYGRWWRLQLCPNSPSIKVLASENINFNQYLICWSFDLCVLLIFRFVNKCSIHDKHTSLIVRWSGRIHATLYIGYFCYLFTCTVLIYTCNCGTKCKLLRIQDNCNRQ